MSVYMSNKVPTAKDTLDSLIPRNHKEENAMRECSSVIRAGASAQFVDASDAVGLGTVVRYTFGCL